MKVEERFLQYVSYETTSDEDENNVSCPSSEKEWALAKHLKSEMEEMGLTDVTLDEHCYLYGFIPASEGFEHQKTVGFISHMDTSPSVSGKDIKPEIVYYEGGSIKLKKFGEINLQNTPRLPMYENQHLIVTDGTTLLGADDKAGVAEIMSTCEYLLAHPEVKHGRIAIGFTPDEEIGRGADLFDVEKFHADFAYTVDGGPLGAMEYENFNAAAAVFTVHGLNIHPGSAKNIMKNAVLMASELISMLPPAETPSHTEGYEGFYHVQGIQGDETKTVVQMIIRDHDKTKFEARKQFVQELVSFLNAKYGAGTFELALKDQYYNMIEKIIPENEFVVKRAENAFREAGVNPVTVPIRGGTDGARLSFMGLPCPNLSTGGDNFHGIYELVSVEAMHKMVDVLVNIAKAE